MNSIVEITNPSKRRLSEREELFLEHLFGEAKGNPVEAKKLAGYPATTPTTSLVKRLRDEINEGTVNYLAQNAPAVVVELVNIVLATAPVIGAREKIAAAKEILDRAGIVKTEKKEVTHTGGLAILPPKDYA